MSSRVNVLDVGAGKAGGAGGIIWGGAVFYLKIFLELGSAPRGVAGRGGGDGYRAKRGGGEGGGGQVDPPEGRENETPLERASGESEAALDDRAALLGP